MSRLQGSGHYVSWAKDILSKTASKYISSECSYFSRIAPDTKPDLDNDVSTDSVSYLMGHASTATTNRFYGRIRNNRAIKEIREVWDGQ